MDSSQTLQQKLKNLPHVPGIYKFRDANGVIIYIGKAKDLNHRVKSYFQPNLDKHSKTYKLVQNIVDLETIEVLSEFEALVLESALIKKHHPKYNIVLKDDKSYLYIVIRAQKVPYGELLVNIPQVIAARETDLQPKDATFGPFPNSGVTKYVLRTVRKLFPFRDCTLSKFNRYKKLKQPCLWGHLGLCSAPCVEKIFPENYREQVARVKKLLSGESTRLIKSINAQMQLASKNQDYEKAAAYRDVLKKFDFARKSFKSAQTYIENPYLVDDLRQKSLEELCKQVPIIKKIPQRIECYDISNISGKEAVGSMVVAVGGKIAKNEYRQFKIKLKDTPDDFSMMREVLLRRIKREFATEKGSARTVKWGMPDLIVLDGGKGQVSAVLEVVSQLRHEGIFFDVPIIGLAKKQETIVYVEEHADSFGAGAGVQGKSLGNFVEINLERSNEGLKLLQVLRDEAHRFAQRYHHKLRLRKIS